MERKKVNKEIKEIEKTNLAQLKTGFPHYRARCSSVVRAFAHGVLGRGIDPSWWTHRAVSHSSQCSTTGVTKACYYVLSCMWNNTYKISRTVNRNE